MKNKIFRSIFFVTILVLLLSTSIIMSVLYKNFERQIHDELSHEAIFISQGLNNIGIDYLKNIKDLKTRITLIDSKGNVFYDNKADTSALGNHNDREEVYEAINTGEGESTRYSQTLKQKILYYAILLKDNTILRVSITHDGLLSLFYMVLKPIIIIFILSVILSVWISSKIANQIIKPINDINLDDPNKCDIYDELSPFISKINKQNKAIVKQLKDMKQKQNEFEAITENMKEGLIIIDRHLNVLFCNDSAIKIFDVDKNIIFSNVFKLNRSQNFRSLIEKSLIGNNAMEIVEINDLIYQIYANPVYKGGELSGSILLIMDITEKSKLEKLRSEFTANVSHELKTPLTSISGIAEIMKNGLVKSQDMQYFAKSIYSESQRMINLVNDIIKLSQLDENAVPAEKESVDLYDLSVAVLDSLKDFAQEKNITLNLKGCNVSVLGVYQILYEMVYNLCDNAIKYNKNFGQVTVNTVKDKKEIRLEVFDTGIGIPKADIKRIFERFYRVDKSHSKKVGGTGLGLSIVKHGAAFHKARIDIQSEIDVGTIVSVIWDIN